MFRTIKRPRRNARALIAVSFPFAVIIAGVLRRFAARVRAGIVLPLFPAAPKEEGRGRRQQQARPHHHDIEKPLVLFPRDGTGGQRRARHAARGGKPGHGRAQALKPSALLHDPISPLAVCSRARVFRRDPGRVSKKLYHTPGQKQNVFPFAAAAPLHPAVFCAILKIGKDPAERALRRRPNHIDERKFFKWHSTRSREE